MGPGAALGGSGVRGQIAVESVVLADRSIAAGKLEGERSGAGGGEDGGLCPAPRPSDSWQLRFHFVPTQTGKACWSLTLSPAPPWAIR